MDTQLDTSWIFIEHGILHHHLIVLVFKSPHFDQLPTIHWMQHLARVPKHLDYLYYLHHFRNHDHLSHRIQVLVRRYPKGNTNPTIYPHSGRRGCLLHYHHLQPNLQHGCPLGTFCDLGADWRRVPCHCRLWSSVQPPLYASTTASSQQRRGPKRLCYRGVLAVRFTTRILRRHSHKEQQAYTIRTATTSPATISLEYD